MTKLAEELTTLLKEIEEKVDCVDQMEYLLRVHPDMIGSNEVEETESELRALLLRVAGPIHSYVSEGGRRADFGALLAKLPTRVSEKLDEYFGPAEHVFAQFGHAPDVDQDKGDKNREAQGCLHGTGEDWRKFFSELAASPMEADSRTQRLYVVLRDHAQDIPEDAYRAVASEPAVQELFRALIYFLLSGQWQPGYANPGDSIAPFLMACGQDGLEDFLASLPAPCATDFPFHDLGWWGEEVGYCYEQIGSGVRRALELAKSKKFAEE